MLRRFVWEKQWSMLMNIKEIYDDLACQYDRSHFYPGSAAEYVERRRLGLILPYLQRSSGMRVLDVACGTGNYLRLAEDFGAEVVGCDISESMLKICRDKGLKALFINDYHYLPFKDETFDLALCVAAIPYSTSPVTVLKELCRVLQDRGTLIFTYFNTLNFRITNYVIKYFKPAHPINHEHRFGPSLLRDISSIGFRPTYACGINYLPFPANEKPRRKRILDFFARLENSIDETQLMHISNETFTVLEKC
jgi:ubiquinone/menaquinone biosynthesis C-methylase UbiE